MGGVHRTVAATGVVAVHANDYTPNSPLALDHDPTVGTTTYSAQDVHQAAREAVTEVALEIKYLTAMGARPEAIEEVFRSFGPPIAVDPSCLAWLRIDNSRDAPATNPCAGTAGVAVGIGPDVGERGAAIDLKEANRMIGSPWPTP